MADTAVLTIRERVAGASRQIARVKRFDQAARFVIILGGIGVVVSVLGILLFIGAEAVPLFRPASYELSGTIAMGNAGGPVMALGADEHQTYLYEVRANGTVALFRVSDGALEREIPIAGFEGVSVRSASRSLDDRIVAGASDGRAALSAVRFTRQYEGETFKGVAVELDAPTIVDVDNSRRPLTAVSYRSSDAGPVVAAVAGNELLLWTQDAEGKPTVTSVWKPTDENITAIQLGGAKSLIAGTDRGRVHHWELETPPRLTDISPVSTRPITAVRWILGDTTFIAGTEAGEISAWFRTRLHDDDEALSMVRAHVFPPQSAAITDIAASSRGRSFITAGADGSLVVRHTTSERTLVSMPGGKTPASAVMLAPKADAVFVARGDAVTRYVLYNPHPEINLSTLFGKIWYDGYARPDYVWQSTGGTDDFETKFSLYPLVFGTIKGTAYALLFAVPLAVMAALYTSQFAHPGVKERVKPAVEVMAALPSVVIGFIAGLWLASLVERILVGVLLMFVLLPTLGTLGVLLWRALPRAAKKVFRPGTEVVLILPLLVVAVWLSLALGPSVEGALFGGDFKAWLDATLGLTYDQRNCLVVGLAMGFAVIPIIFTISEDAFSNVPSNLTAASLALGASRWQTALRVVLPTASPGVFSAIMVGFGRAVGETMIVLMATGNTPVLDWSMFNGMRTLSANIAVEIPEAPHGDTLYRVLFFSAALLFTMTFTVNTVAEVIRQRLRQKYRAL
jgi:phosphate transport system permease protein